MEERQVKHKDKEEISTINAIAYGNWATKLTLLVSGFGNIYHKQFVKGLIFLSMQISAILLFFTFGWQYVSNMNTLGTHTMRSEIDPTYGIAVNVPGDNSLQILLFSIFAIAIMLLAFAIHLAAVRSSYAAEIDIKRGRQPTSFITDLRNMLDKNIHTAMLGLPTLGVLAFTVIPIVFMILLAFTNFDRLHQPPGNLFTWVGLRNFFDTLSFNGIMGHTFTKVLGWTLIWAVFATFLNYFLGMTVALMINKKGIHLKSLWRTCFVISIAVPGFVTLLFMRQMLADTGSINELLKSDFAQRLGLSTVQFLRDPAIARVTVIIVNLWIGIPYTMLITSGILMNIPEDLYEAARIDGAGPAKQFQAITLPYMLTITAPYLITQFIGNINNFNAIYFLTAGGPPATDYYNAGKTDLLVTWLYKLTVTHGDYNLASVIGIFAFIISAIIALVTFNITASAQKEETFR
ncbi:MAG: sugar ABC transporter permease [Oscillospiraceae bacterium]|nr:sugar ABC transporter permease [Oscillospiraceae bacterium]